MTERGGIADYSSGEVVINGVYFLLLPGKVAVKENLFFDCQRGFEWSESDVVEKYIGIKKSDK